MARVGDLSDLVERASAGDEPAFRALYREVHPGLLRYLSGLVGDDAEDVASETWLQIARDIRSYREEGHGFRAWAVSIARHRALDHLRRVRRRPGLTTPVENVAHLAAVDDTEMQGVEAVSTRLAIAWIATLPPDQAEAILLRVVVGLDVRQTAAVLGKRLGAVRTAAYRGLRRLAQQLSSDTETAPEQPGRRPGVTFLRPSTPKRTDEGPRP
jgi:RNA polymerase sigma-70 factor, ECF subfamily